MGMSYQKRLDIEKCDSGFMSSGHDVWSEVNEQIVVDMHS
jgi:hypothetical protein